MVGKWVSIVAGIFGVSVAGFLFLGHGGFGSGSGTVTPTPIDPGPAISRSGDAMRQLQSMDVVINGSLGAGDTGVQITGTGKLVYPHEETLSLQLRIPAKVAGDLDTIVAINERITKGRVLIQIPSQGPSYKDVTNEQSAQIVPGMDPVANLAFSHAFRAADDQGDVQLDGVDDLILLGHLHALAIHVHLPEVHREDQRAVEPDPLHDLAERVVEGQRLDAVTAPGGLPVAANLAPGDGPVWTFDLIGDSGRSAGLRLGRRLDPGQLLDLAQR